MVIAGLPMLGWMGAAVSIAGSGLVLTHSVASIIRSRRDVRVPRVFFPDEAGNLLPLSVHDAWSAKLVPYRAAGEWYLSGQHRRLDSTHAQTRSSRWVGLDQAPDPVKLRGDVALRALATLLPHANMMGATRRKIHEAVRVIETSSSVHQLMYKAVETQTRWSTAGSTPITGLPAQLRLAMEMVLQEEDERSALEGELVALEQRWREAEEVAAIADSLLVSPATEARLEYLQRSNRG